LDGVVAKVTSNDWPSNLTLSTTRYFRTDFPKLKPYHCDLVNFSGATTDYNCIAWAASETTDWWWPDDPVIGNGYWPLGVPREETIPAFIAAYETLGYRKCKRGWLERGFEKIAIYADSAGVPTHAARQLENGSWTTKFGPYEDVEHVSLGCLNGPLYGKAVAYMKRRI
jgi:hypothetical protein